MGVLVNGANSAFGKATIKAFLGRNFPVVGVDVEPKMDGLDNCDYFQSDFRKYHNVKEVFSKLKKHPDIVVNCAHFVYTQICYNKFRDATFGESYFESTQTTNVIASYNLIYQLYSSSSPSVMVNTSFFSDQGCAGHSALVSASSALNSMASALVNFGKGKVSLVTISPGLFHNECLRDLPPDLERAISYLSCFPYRFGQPEEYAHIVVEAALNRACHGVVIPIDAGLRLPP